MGIIDCCLILSTDLQLLILAERGGGRPIGGVLLPEGGPLLPVLRGEDAINWKGKLSIGTNIIRLLIWVETSFEITQGSLNIVKHDYVHKYG